MPGKRAPLEVRFWAKVDRSGECWQWTASLDSHGYGQIGRGGAGAGIARAHRVAYELLVGPIPEGLDIDHLCRNRACVNPAHMETVTRRENVLRGIGLTAANARKTCCVRGHRFTKANTYWHDGERHCRVCRAECQRARARCAAHDQEGSDDAREAEAG